MVFITWLTGSVGFWLSYASPCAPLPPHPTHSVRSFQNQQLSSWAGLDSAVLLANGLPVGGLAGNPFDAMSQNQVGSMVVVAFP